MSPAVVNRDGIARFDMRYIQHPDVISLTRARAGEPMEWETDWGGRVKVRAIPILDPQSSCTGVLGAAVDLSRLEASEQRRISVEEILFALFENSGLSIAILSRENRLIYANESYTRLHEENSDKHLPVGDHQNFSPHAVRLNVPSPTSPDSHLTVLIESPRDTDQAADTQSAPDAGLRDQLINGFPRAVAIIDSEGTTISINQEFTKVTGFDNKSVRGRHISIVFHDLTEDALRDLWQEIKQTHDPSIVSRELSFVDSSRKIYRARVTFSRTSPSSTSIMMTLDEWSDVCSWADSHLRTTRFSVTDRKILELLAAGNSNSQIAAELHLSRQGLDYRIKSLRDRLGAQSRGALVGKAFADGLFSFGTWPPRMID
ncbi:PAS domain S-box protein (plasmid) [Streptomyces murinus]|uniref:PAS domain S-box protein n=1 Tax=Streptomyces murinus TaxID=33900 RepID=UPI001552145E|nr:PAS domain S-box protein [Streptomyces murinus]WDO11205.1 PAS domain S-box protein [Streptomyces murinus]